VNLLDFEKIEKTDDDGRLKRPVAVAVFGCLLSVACIAIEFEGTTAPFLIGFLAFAFVASGIYAFIGWRFSQKLAGRILGIAGGIVVLGGLAFLVWLVLARGPNG
jgi:hypothetical protein